MWSAILEWVKALGLGVGSLIGVFVGARLTRGTQDRQFVRERAAQRVDRARAAFQEGVTLGRRLERHLRPPGQEDGQMPTPGAEVLKFSDDLLEVCPRLEGEGAKAVADPLYFVAGLGKILFATAHGHMSLELEEYRDLWVQMVNKLGEAGEVWERWQEDQEAAWGRRPGRWRWLRHGSSRAQLPEHDPPDAHG